MACDPDKLRGVGVEAGEALSGKGVRIKAPSDDFSLASLPPEALEALRGCEVVEIVYPDGRVVYVTGRWVERVVERVGKGASTGREARGG